MKRSSIPFLFFLLMGQVYPQDTADNNVRVERSKNWVDQDVRWIICLAEKTVFERLTSDKDRREFIEAFWYRRDPKPETTLNEAKEEHYRRVDYADGHFREGEVRGSMTERGRIWIMYGSPQRREVRPPTAGRRYSSEIWHYDKIPDVGENLDLEFVDRDNRGEYRLELSPEKRESIFTLWPCGKTISDTISNSIGR